VDSDRVTGPVIDEFGWHLDSERDPLATAKRYLTNPLLSDDNAWGVSSRNVFNLDDYISGLSRNVLSRQNDLATHGTDTLHLVIIASKPIR